MLVKSINKIFFIVFILALFLCSNLYAEQATIYNFTDGIVNFTMTNPKMEGSIESFNSQMIFYTQKKEQIKIIASADISKKTCIVEPHLKQDIFVIQKNNQLKCSLRAERLPKEF